MLNEIFSEENAMKHSDENRHYGAIYEKWFCSKRKDIKNVLEIGVHKGGALRSWARYFYCAKVYGVDIKDKFNTDKEYDKSRVQFKLGSAVDEQFMLKAYPKVEFDVIIDDASHMVEHQRATFDIMFQRVAPGGVYIVEDVHTSYWPEFNGGYKRKNNFVEIAKNLADMVNFRAYKKSDRAREYKVSKEVTWLEKNIESVSFYRGLCFIERKGE